MIHASRELLQSEEARLRVAYSRRREQVPKDLYSCFNLGNLLIIQERERRVLGALARQGKTVLERARLLEIGCGSGFWIREFIKWGVQPENIVGIELLPERIDEAKCLCPSGVTLVLGNAARPDFPDCSFDLVMQSMVFSSILDYQLKAQIAHEMQRVLRPDGLILWYDFHVNNPKNPDVRGVSKSEIHRLFPGCRISLERLTLLPPLARAVGPRSPLLLHFLSVLKLLCTHYLGVIEKYEPRPD